MAKEGMWAWFQRNEKKIMTGLVIGILPAFGFGYAVIGTLTGKYTSEAAIVIDGDEVSMKDYESMRRRFLEPAKTFHRRLKSDPRQQRWIQDMVPPTNKTVWKRLMLLKEAEEAGIRVSDKEVKDYIEKSETFDQVYPYGHYIFSGWGGVDTSWYKSDLRNFFHTVSMPDEGQKEKKFRPADYARMLKGRGISVEDFEQTVREDLMLQKYRFIAGTGDVITSQSMYEKFCAEREMRRLAYVRFNIDDIKIEEKELKEEDLKRFLNSHNRDFQDPRRKSFEYIYGDYASLEKLIDLSETEMKGYYEEKKEELFVLKEEKKDEKSGEKEEEKDDKDTGEEKKEEKKDTEKEEGDEKEGEEGKKKEGPGAEKKDTEEKAAEEDEPRFKPFDDPEVQTRIKKDLKRKKAEDILEALLTDISGRLKKIEERIRREPGADLKASLASNINYPDVAGKIHKDPKKWGLGSYPAYRLQTLRTERAYSKTELPRIFGLLGIRIVTKVFSSDILRVQDPLKLRDGFVLLRGVEDIQPATPPLAEIREKVRKAYWKNRREGKAREQAMTLRKKMEASGFQKAAEEAGLKVQHTVFFEKGDVSLPGDGVDPPLGRVKNLVSTGFTLKSGEISQIVTEDDLDALFLVTVLEKKSPLPLEMGMNELGKLRQTREGEVKEETDEVVGTKVLERHEWSDMIRQRSTRVAD